MKRIVTTDDVTGHVLADWRGGDEQTLAPVAGRTHRQLASGDTASYSGTRWNGSAFEPIPPAPVRVIPAIDFMRRFTREEENAIDALADTNRDVKRWMRRAMKVDTVNLDHAEVIGGLAYLKSVGIPSVWADTATADARIIEIRA